MFAGGAEPLSPARLGELTRRVDRMIGGAGVLVRGGMRFALLVLWLSPILLGLHAATLPRLPIEARTKVLRALERSRFTNLLLMFVGVRAIMTMIFYEDPAELAHMGYRASHQSRYLRHTRQLSVLQPRLGEVPAPLESGVRLREDADEASDANASGERQAVRKDVA